MIRRRRPRRFPAPPRRFPAPRCLRLASAARAAAAAVPLARGYAARPTQEQQLQQRLPRQRRRWRWMLGRGAAGQAAAAAAAALCPAPAALMQRWWCLPRPLWAARACEEWRRAQWGTQIRLPAPPAACAAPPLRTGHAPRRPPSPPPPAGLETWGPGGRHSWRRRAQPSPLGARGERAGPPAGGHPPALPRSRRRPRCWRRRRRRAREPVRQMTSHCTRCVPAARQPRVQRQLQR